MIGAVLLYECQCLSRYVIIRVDEPNIFTFCEFQPCVPSTTKTLIFCFIAIILACAKLSLKSVSKRSVSSVEPSSTEITSRSLDVISVTSLRSLLHLCAELKNGITKLNYISDLPSVTLSAFIHFFKLYITYHKFLIVPIINNFTVLHKVDKITLLYRF